MRLQLTDWNYVEAIEFSFIEADKTATQNYLNAAYAQKLTNLTSLITYRYGTKTLRPGAIPNIKSLVAESITKNLPESEVSAKYKEHIQLLLDKTNIWYIDNHGMRQLVHDDQVLAIAANEARYNSDWNRDPTIQLELSIQHWGFRSGWFPYKFTKVYDKTVELQPVSYDNRVANILKFSRRIISRDNDFCFDLPDPYFEYVAFEQIYRMAFPPSYTWTWKYSPNSDSVSFHRVRCNSISFRRSTSSSSCRVRCQQDKSHMTPTQCQDKSNVTASYETPSTMPNSDHHSAPPLAPTNFGWTFNPQNEIATFRRAPQSTLAEDTNRPHAAPAYIRSLQSPCHNHIFSRPNHPPVLRLSKRHRDALKVKLYTYISVRFSASRISFQGYVNLIQADAIDFDSQQRIHVVAFLRHSIAFRSLNRIPHSTEDFYNSIPLSALDNSFWNRQIFFSPILDSSSIDPSPLSINKQLNIDLQGLKLAIGAPPQDLIEDIYDLQRKYQYKSVSPSLDELIVAFKAALPANLLMQLTPLLDELQDADTSELEFWEAINLQAASLYKSARSVQSRGGKAKEMSLFGAEMTDFANPDTRDKWPTNAVCYWCKEKGHKAYNCEKRKAGHPRVDKKTENTNNGNSNNSGNGNRNNNNGSNRCSGKQRGRRKCGICGGNHRDAVCYEDEKNAARRPAGWKFKLKDVQGGIPKIEDDVTETTKMKVPISSASLTHMHIIHSVHEFNKAKRPLNWDNGLKLFNKFPDILDDYSDDAWYYSEQIEEIEETEENFDIVLGEFIQYKFSNNFNSCRNHKRFILNIKKTSNMTVHKFVSMVSYHNNAILPLCPVKCFVVDAKMNYHFILGRKTMKDIGIKMDFENSTMTWYEKIMPFHPPSYFHGKTIIQRVMSNEPYVVAECYMN
eukprot:jgi/Psemu1/44243/gm1.44243_g